MSELYETGRKHGLLQDKPLTVVQMCAVVTTWTNAHEAKILGN